MTSPILGGAANGHAIDLNSPVGAAVFEALRKDSLQNLVTGLGVEGKDARLSTTIVSRTQISQSMIDTLYEQNDIFPLIIDRIPEHGTRRWIRMTGAQTSSGRPDKDFGRTAIEALEALDTQQAIFDLWRLHRKDGGSAIFMGVNDGQDPEMPLNLETVQSVDFLHVLTRYEITPGDVDRNPKSKNFRKPEFYALTGEDTQRIHHSRVIRLPRHMVSSETSAGGAGGWDGRVADRVWEPLRQFMSILGYVEACFQDIAQGVMGIKGLAELMAAGDVGSNAVINRVRTIALVRSALNVILLDEGETYERRSQFPAGIDTPILRSMDRLCAASKTPESILFMQAPTGFSKDDAGGRKNFYDSVGNEQNRFLRPGITRILDAVLAAKKGPFKGRAPSQWSFEFRPLEEPNEKEIAERRKLDSDFETAQIANGVFASEEVRSRYENDPDCPYQLSDEVSEALKAANAPIAPDDAEDESIDDEIDDAEIDAELEDDDVREDSFDNSKHPRDEDGKFTDGGGGGSSGGSSGGASGGGSSGGGAITPRTVGPETRSNEEIAANTARIKAATAAIKVERERLKKEFMAKMKAEKKRQAAERKLLKAQLSALSKQIPAKA